jgi:hypothetical protein
MMQDVGEMISPTPPRDFAAPFMTSDNAKFGWGAGRIILPAFLLFLPVAIMPTARDRLR